MFYLEISSEPNFHDIGFCLQVSTDPNFHNIDVLSAGIYQLHITETQLK